MSSSGERPDSLPDPSVTVAIVGASVAGVAAARGLRAEGFSGRIVLIGEESEWPYDRPPLSKQVLTGEWSPKRIALLEPAEAETLGIEVRLGVAAEGLDPDERVVKLADGSAIHYGACVIATGVRARPAPWPQLPGMHLLRTLADANGLREQLDHVDSVAVIGGGFIGAEVATAARSLGLEVTVIDPLPLPMARVVGDDAARVFIDLAETHGVQHRLGVGVSGIEDEGPDGGLDVTLTDGSRLHAGAVVIGIGAVPNDGWVADSGLLIGNGVVCDAYGRALRADGSSRAPGVYAAGDVARQLHVGIGENVRVEHWTNAVEQGNCVAHNIVHPEDLRVHDAEHYVWSDQHGWKFQFVGRPVVAVEVHLVGQLEGERPRAVWIYADIDGQLVGAMSVNWPRALVMARRALAEGADAGTILNSLRGTAPSPSATASIPTTAGAVAQK